MNRYLKLAAFLFVVGVSLVAAKGVSAQALSWTGTDATVTINANNYTIVAGSAATSIVVGATTLTVTVPASSTFTFQSANKYLLNNDQVISQQCSNSNNQLAVTGPVTAVITPDATATCVVSNAGGSSGGGGGGGGPYTDVTPPSGTSMVIASGATETTLVSVTLTLAATGATEMMLSNTSDFAGRLWESYATSKVWTLTSGDGTKTVYAKFRDAALNVSAAVSDTITLKTTTTPTTTTTTTPTTTTTTTPQTPEERQQQIVTIGQESTQVVQATPEALASAVGASRDTGLEQRYDSTIVARVIVAGTPAATKAQVVNFVTYGTPTTVKLGAGERAGVVNSYRTAFGKVPSSEGDWNDVIKIANGRFPGAANAARETSVEPTFRKIYLRAANRANANDDAAITVMAYGLRSASRNLNSEKASILTFKAIYGRNPTSAADWDAVRAVAYSGAKR